MHNINSMEEFLGIATALYQLVRNHQSPSIQCKDLKAPTFEEASTHYRNLPKADDYNNNRIKFLGRFGVVKKEPSTWHGDGTHLTHLDVTAAFDEMVSYFKAHTKEVTEFAVSKKAEWTRPLTATEKSKFLFRGITVKNKFAFRITGGNYYFLYAMVYPTYECYSGSNDDILLDPAEHEPKEVHLTEQLKEAAEKITVWDFLNGFLKTTDPDGNPDYVSVGRCNDRMDQTYDLLHEVLHMTINPDEVAVGRRIAKDLQATHGGRTTRHDNIVRLHIIPWVAEAPEKHIGESDPYKEVAQVLLQDPDALAPYMEWLNKKQAKLLK
jgi:hypothetical protein